MAAGPYKLNVFYSLFTNGWSETYYLNQTSQDAAYTQAQALLLLRQALMAAPATMLAFRIADTQNLRNSQLYRLGVEGFTPTTGAKAPYASQADEVNVSADMTLYSDAPALAQRKIYLRGNPDEAYDVANPGNADAQKWLNNYSAFGTYLAGGGGNAAPVQIRYKPRLQFLGSPLGIPINGQPVLSWLATSPSTTTDVVTFAALGAIPGGFVTFYKMKGLPFPPGLTEVLAVTPIAGTTPPQVTLNVRYRTPSDYVYPGGGYGVDYTSNNFASVAAFSPAPLFSRRITGRPFEVSRGRRRSIAR